jgi:MFS superfamily sulfate permease-like transporter
MHGIFLLLIVVSIPFVLNIIPLAVLASILIIVGYKLAKPSLFKQMYRIGWKQFLPFIVTIVGIVFTDLLIGIALGVAVGLFIPLITSARNSHFLHQEEVDNGHHNVMMRLAEEVTFLNKGAILKALNNLPIGTHLTIDMSESISIDYDVLEIIVNFKNTGESKGYQVKLINKKKIRTADY